MTSDGGAERQPSKASVVRIRPEAAAPGRRPTGPSDDPPRRGLIVAIIFIVVLAGAGYYVVRTMMTIAKLQDCAASGRRDC